ncbi:MAG: T9SS type A sorting domain-containing protein [Ignavibacteriota bacterium]
MKYFVLSLVILISWFAEAESQVITKVVDINPYGSSYPRFFFTFNNRLFFRANDTIRVIDDETLWSTDGTVKGTTKINDLKLLATIECNNNLYFYSYDDSGRFSLWKTSGSSGTTELVTYFHQRSNYTGGFGVLNNIMYFGAEDSVKGYELWRSDGTDTGTVLFEDLNPNGSSAPFNFINLGDKLYFFSYDSLYNLILWSTEGKPASTKQILELIQTSSVSPRLTVLKNKLYFIYPDTSGDQNLWISDGTGPGTMILKQISGPGSPAPTGFTRMGDSLYFVARDGLGKSALWLTDGTAAGTKDLVELNPSTSLTPFQNKLYFSAPDKAGLTEPFVTDGTTSGTKNFVTINKRGDNANTHSFTPFKGKLYFIGSDGNSDDIYVTDGTSEGTRTLGPFDSPDFPTKPFAYFSGFFEFDGKLFFSANYDNKGVELWTITDINERVRTPTDQSGELRPSVVHSSLQLEVSAPTTISIYDPLGKIVLIKRIVASEEINVSHLGSGIYFLRNEDNTFRAKFIKE